MLARVMLRSSKAGCTEARLLPPCSKDLVRLPFDPQHQVPLPPASCSDLVWCCYTFTGCSYRQAGKCIELSLSWFVVLPYYVCGAH